MAEKSSDTFQTTQSKINHLRRFLPVLFSAFRLVLVIFAYKQFPIANAAGLQLFLTLIILIAVDFIIRLLMKPGLFTGILILVELFIFQILPFYLYELLDMEALFVFLCLMEICFCFSTVPTMIINSIVGIIWAPAMSYSFELYMADSSLSLVPSAVAGMHFTFILDVLVSCAIGIMIGLIDKVFKAHEQENRIYKNLDAINRSISSEMFGIKAASEQKAKKEVTKYIHDNIGYVLTNLTMMLQAASAVNQSDPDRGQEMLEKCIDYSHSGLNEIRMFLRNLQKDSGKKIDIHREIKNLAALFEKCTGTEVIVEVGEWPSTLTKDINAFILSFVKEGLTNAVKHGMATQVLISCSVPNRYKVGMSIISYGKVPDGKIEYGLGLQSIQESIGQLGGTLKVSRTSNSFVTSVMIPYVTMQQNG